MFGRILGQQRRKGVQNKHFSLISGELNATTYEHLVQGLKSASADKKLRVIFGTHLSKSDGKPENFRPSLETIVPERLIEQLTLGHRIVGDAFTNELFGALQASDKNVLQKLTLSNNTISLKAMLPIASFVQSAPQLEEFIAAQCTLFPGALRELSKAIGKSGIKRMTLSSLQYEGPFLGSSLSVAYLFNFQDCLVKLSLFALRLNEQTMTCFAKLLAFNRSLAEISVFQCSPLDDKVMTYLTHSVIQRKIKVKYYASLARYGNVAALALNKALRLGYIEYLSIRGTDVGPVGLKNISSGFAIQSVTSYFSIRLMKMLPKQDSSWDAFAMAILQSSSLEELLLTTGASSEFLVEVVSASTQYEVDWRPN